MGFLGEGIRYSSGMHAGPRKESPTVHVRFEDTHSLPGAMHRSPRTLAQHGEKHGLTHSSPSVTAVRVRSRDAT